MGDRRVRVQARSHILHGLLAGCWWWQETCVLVGGSGDAHEETASEQTKMWSSRKEEDGMSQSRERLGWEKSGCWYANILRP